jgi:uncharacterized membrane protein
MKIFRSIISFFAIIIGLYPSIYFVVDRRFGLLSTKSNEVLLHQIWNIGFYIHIIFGGIALLIGWIQFNPSIRARYLRLHQLVGKLYLVSVGLSSIAGFYIAFYATGGIISTLGFMSLSVIWFYTSLNAYLKIRHAEVDQHKNWMIYSYAACFAAVTLRIWLPLLTFIFSDFIIGYQIVAWLCWVPNIIVANLIIKRLRESKL